MGKKDASEMIDERAHAKSPVNKIPKFSQAMSPEKMVKDMTK